MKKLLKVLLKLLNGTRDYVLVFMLIMMEICTVLVSYIEKKIDAVASYILEKYE
jgi:hypothetical protein